MAYHLTDVWSFAAWLSWLRMLSAMLAINCATSTSDESTANSLVCTVPCRAYHLNWHLGRGWQELHMFVLCDGWRQMMHTTQNISKLIHSHWIRMRFCVALKSTCTQRGHTLDRATNGYRDQLTKFQHHSGVITMVAFWRIVHRDSSRNATRFKHAKKTHAACKVIHKVAALLLSAHHWKRDSHIRLCG